MTRGSGRRSGAASHAGVTAALIAMCATVVVVAMVLAMPAILTSAGLRTSGRGAPTIAPSLFSPTPVEPPAPAGPIAAPAPASAATGATAATLGAQLRALPQGQKGVSATLVIDPATSAVLVSQNPTRMLIPASNMKTLVSVATLTALDPEHTFATTVVRGTGNQIVLKGGGDPYLSSQPNPDLPGGPTLAQLADATATSLKSAKVTTVTVAVDDTLFSGPSWNPTWPATYDDQVTPIGALMVDGGRVLDKQGKVVPGSPRADDAGLDAGARFIALLKQRGITVSGQPTRAVATGETLAEVTSLPLHTLVVSMMVHSDNTAAEMFLRHVGIAGGQPGSFVGGVNALKATLTTLGIWQNGAIIHDGSGLSRDNRISANMLGAAWLEITSAERTRALLAALPVAGVTGTLAGRFTDPAAAAGRGFVHGKTGTLTGVSSLSGWTLTRQGQPLLIVFMVNESTNDFLARVWIDQSAATVTACGC